MGRWVVSIAVSLIVMAVAGIAGVMALVYLQARTDEARPVDAIIVLGAAQYNGDPSPVFRARLAHALELYNAGVAPRIVLTGGKQPGDQFTEAESGIAWLADRGVPMDAMLMENEGHSTWGSLQRVPAVLPASGTRVLVVSDGFHLFRSELMLRHLGYTPYSSPVSDGPIKPWSPVEFSYVIRETGGVLVFLPTMIFG